MPESLESLAVALFFVAPGLLYEIGIERQVGYWRTGLGDRALRFFVHSVLLQAILLPATWFLWTRYALHWPPRRFPWPLWPAALAYFIGPLVAGLAVGGLTRRNVDSAWMRWLVGRDPAPRAWDYLFSRIDLNGVVRVRLRTAGGWRACTAAMSGSPVVGPMP